MAGYEKAIQSAFRDVSDALSARHWLAEQVEVLRATVAAQGERARLAQLRYDHGASPYLEVLDAQRDLLAAQRSWCRRGARCCPAVSACTRRWAAARARLP